MQIHMLKSKIHRATVTEANLNYEGSISIDPKLCDLAKLRAWEQVDILNCNNGERFTTYVILGKPGQIGLNGAAARRVQPGDKVIIVSYATMTEEEAASYTPKALFVDDNNEPKELRPEVNA
jgi:aspartate 1-decarboxylase